MKFLFAALLFTSALVRAEGPATVMTEAAAEKELPLGVSVAVETDPIARGKVAVTISVQTGLDDRLGEVPELDGLLEIWSEGELLAEIPVSRWDEWGLSTFEFRVSRALLDDAEFHLTSYHDLDELNFGGIEILRIQLAGFPILPAAH